MDQTLNQPTIIQLDRGLAFQRRDCGGRSIYIAHQHESGKYFHFGPEEYHVASLLNGHRSASEVQRQMHDDGIDWTGEEIAEFISKMIANKLAKPVGIAMPSQPTNPIAWYRRLPAYLSLLISQRIPLVNGHQLASFLDRNFGFVFNKVGIVYWTGLVISGLMIVTTHRQDFAAELQRMFDPDVWVFLVLMWMVAKVIHELGHATAARHHGVRVGKIGIMFFLLAPLAYVDVTDAWKLRNRWTRVQIALAGVYLELAIAAISAWVWWWMPAGYCKHLAAQMILVAGPATLLVNANPLLRLDGYYVLSDLTEIPNLRMHGRNQISNLCNQWLLGTPAKPALLFGWRKNFATLHALASVTFQIVWMTGLVVGVSYWAHGLGVLLALAAVLLWAVFPLARWFVRVWFSDPGGRFYLNDVRLRLICYASLVVLLTENLSMSDSPLARRVPVVVQFHDEQIARARVDAFVDHVHVSRGQRVSQGMLLMELRDPELLLEREKKADDIKLAELRAVQFRRQGWLSKAAAEVENSNSLSRQLAELDDQIAGLQVFAERDGLIISPQLDYIQGCYVHRGDELLRVCDPQEKELLVSVPAEDMEAFQRAAKAARPTTVRLRGGTKLAATPALLRPRARQTLPHPALAATAGGPLAVEPSPDGDPSMRLVQPHLESRTPLDPATSELVRDGQVGTMTIADNRSLLDRFYDAMIP